MDTKLFSNRQLKSLILPLVIEQILVMSVGLADTLMISSVGEAAISGVALVDMVNNLVITILAALSTGGAVIVSQYLGSRDQGRAQQSAEQLVLLSGGVSLLFMGVALTLHRGILSLLFGGVDPAVMESASTYFFISALSFPFLGIYNSCAALFRSMSKTKVTMYVSLLMNVINVVGNALGIFVFRAGVAGVAVPTLISRGVAALLLLGLLTSSKNQVSLHLRSLFRIKWELLKKILSVAIPGGVENGLFQLGRVLVTSIVALFGTAQIAANGVAGSVDMVAIVVVNAVNLAVVTVVGQCVGAGAYDQAQANIKKLLTVSYIATGVLGLVVVLLLPVILQWYALGTETLGYAYLLIILHNILAFLLHPTSFVLSNALRAAGDVKYCMFVGVGSMLVFRLGAALFFGVFLNLGVLGVWIAMGMDWLGRSVFFLLRYRSGKWRQFKKV